MLIKTNALNAQQRQELTGLIAQCQQVDESVPNLYLHLISKARAIDGVFLYYNDQQQLIAFLAVYFFYEDAVEVGLLVHPKARRQGLARYLLQQLLPVIDEYQCQALIFTVPARHHTSWLSARGLTYLHREYFMARQSLTPVLEYQSTLHFRRAQAQDIPFLCALDEACFHKKTQELIARFYQILHDSHYEIMLAFKGKTPIAKAHFRWQDQGAALSDIAVFPEYQGQGFGTALIAYCINYALSQGKPNLCLDVETHNQKALNLYIRLGFLSQNACDYWQMPSRLLQNLAKS